MCYVLLKMLLRDTVLFNCNSRFNQSDGPNNNFRMVMVVPEVQWLLFDEQLIMSLNEGHCLHFFHLHREILSLLLYITPSRLPSEWINYNSLLNLMSLQILNKLDFQLKDNRFKLKPSE
jgi:hypothetical protein